MDSLNLPKAPRAMPYTLCRARSAPRIGHQKSRLPFCLGFVLGGNLGRSAVRPPHKATIVAQAVVIVQPRGQTRGAVEGFYPEHRNHRNPSLRGSHEASQ